MLLIAPSLSLLFLLLPGTRHHSTAQGACHHSNLMSFHTVQQLDRAALQGLVICCFVSISLSLQGVDTLIITEAWL